MIFRRIKIYHPLSVIADFMSAIQLGCSPSHDRSRHVTELDTRHKGGNDECWRAHP